MLLGMKRRPQCLRYTAIVVGLTWIVGCRKADELPERPPIPVTLFRIASSPPPLDSRYSANVEAYSVARVSGRVGGNTVEITQVSGADGNRDLQPGDRIRKGQVLAKVDDAPYQQQLAAARAALTGDEVRMVAARDQHERYLAAGNAVAKSQVENSRANYQSATAAVERALHTVEEARLQASYCTITSPRDGLLLKRTVEVGDLVRPGSVLFEIGDTRRMKVVFGVPSTLAGRIAIGTELPVTVAALDELKLRGPVTRVSPTADPRSRLFDVEVTVTNEDGALKVGMIATLDLPGSVTQRTTPPLLVPIDAIVRPPGDPDGFAVYVPDPDLQEPTSGMAREKSVARLRRIEVGRVRSDEVEVKGLEIGDSVIVRGSTIVHDGAVIGIMP